MPDAPSIGANELVSQAVGGTTTRYRRDVGWNVLNEEDNLGNLTRTHKGRSTAHVDGTNPATRTWRFYVHDHLGSTRGVYNSDKTPYAGLEHTPYGEVYASSGSIGDITRRYTGHDWDDAAELYYAPYRYYAPGLARWITRDPLGMVDEPNVYGYVANAPTSLTDSWGLFSRPWGDTYEYWHTRSGKHGPNYTRHCGAMCEITVLATSFDAWFVGWANENWENEGSKDDWHNNSTGRKCGRRLKKESIPYLQRVRVHLDKIRRECESCCDECEPSKAEGTIPPRFGPQFERIRRTFGW
ncbi:MAG: RHS repeat domain-containing protein [Candidatus Hydrogenedentales bacterium]|jgi:RHS repeat-associated protein